MSRPIDANGKSILISLPAGNFFTATLPPLTLQWAERWLAPQSHGSVKKCFATGVEEARAAASTPTKVARQREKKLGVFLGFYSRVSAKNFLGGIFSFLARQREKFF